MTRIKCHDCGSSWLVTIERGPTGSGVRCMFCGKDHLHITDVTDVQWMAHPPNKPNQAERVLVACSYFTGGIGVAQYRANLVWYADAQDTLVELVEPVTHWMPLPPAPQRIDVTAASLALLEQGRGVSNDVVWCREVDRLIAYVKTQSARCNKCGSVLVPDGKGGYYGCADCLNEAAVA